MLVIKSGGSGGGGSTLQLKLELVKPSSFMRRRRWSGDDVVMVVLYLYVQNLLTFGSQTLIIDKKTL